MQTVEFPGLWGLEFTINRVAFYVFGQPIFWYGIIIAVGILLGTFLGVKHSKYHDIKKDDFIDTLLVAVPSAVIVARLYYVVFQWELYKDNLGSIFNLRTGGLAIYGGVIGAVLATFVFMRYKKIKPMKMIDFACCYIPLGQAIGRWGNFINQEAFGINTTLPWGMRSQTTISQLESLKELAGEGLAGIPKTWDIQPSMPVHPTFLYESLWNLAIFALLLYIRKKKKFEGEVFFMYMALYGFGRFFVEALRTDSLMIGDFRVSQLLALGFFVVFLGLVIYRRFKLKTAK